MVRPSLFSRDGKALNDMRQFVEVFVFKWAISTRYFYPASPLRRTNGLVNMLRGNMLRDHSGTH